MKVIGAVVGAVVFATILAIGAKRQGDALRQKAIEERDTD
jgi:hypothetical protein